MRGGTQIAAKITGKDDIHSELVRYCRSLASGRTQSRRSIHNGTSPRPHCPCGRNRSDRRSGLGVTMTVGLAFVLLFAGCSLFLLAMTVQLWMQDEEERETETTGFDPELYKVQNMSWEAFCAHINGEEVTR